MSDDVRIFRCSKCGKWSHAKKKPTKHGRWVTEGDPEYRSALLEPGAYDHMNGFVEPPGHLVDCGPFVPYIAHPESPHD